MVPKKSAASVTLGKTVRSLREAQGYVQKSAAARIRMSPRYYGAFERGELNPTVDTIGKVIVGFGVSFADLFGKAGL
jgi:transcriptional regulator with XRE-family HTH domain